MIPTKHHINLGMPKHLVNLDALILREDLEILSPDASKPSTGGPVGNFLIGNLEMGQPMFEVLRKPHFQRDTCQWTPEQIVQLVKNFLDEELIPAIIFWKSPSSKNIFVIDGAHRLSALIAWIHDDFGDKSLSEKLFGSNPDDIPKAQRQAAKLTRELFEKEGIGSYASLKSYIASSAGKSDEKSLRARNIASVQIITQTVPNDAAHAEASFYRINQGGAVLDDTEAEIIQKRARPEAVAARAIHRAGTGNKYWKRFIPEKQAKVEELSRQIYNLLYKPEIEEPYRTIDFPMGGRGYNSNTLAICYELIHLCNELSRPLSEKKKKRVFLPLPPNDPLKDSSGDTTIEYLKSVKKISEIIASEEHCSLGLHPAIYSYSATGKFQPAGLFAQVELIKRLKSKDGFFEFTSCRKQFEDFLIEYRYFLNQLVGGQGGMTRGLKLLVILHETVLKGISDGKTNEQIRNEVVIDERFKQHLRIVPLGQESSKKSFSQATKAAIRLRDFLKAAALCPICGARLYPHATSIDHKVRLQDGGSSGRDSDGQTTHPYCNTGYKEKLNSLQQTKA